MLQFENVSRGVTVTHGSGGDGRPIHRYAKDGMPIHGVQPGQIGEMQDGPGARHLEAQGLIRVLSREPTKDMSALEAENAALKDKLSKMIVEPSNEKDRRIAELEALVATATATAPAESAKSKSKAL